MPEETTSSFISPSLAEQFREMVGETAGSDLLATDKKAEEPEQVFEAEDLQGVVECPFDIAALVSKFPNFQLDDKESKRLAKMFCKPLNRLAANVKNADLILACSTLATVMMEKWFMYKIYMDDQKKRHQQLQAIEGATELGKELDDEEPTTN